MKKYKDDVDDVRAAIGLLPFRFACVQRLRHYTLVKSYGGRL